jgi:hypothetical protein
VALSFGSRQRSLFAGSLYNEPLSGDLKLALEVTFPADER